MIETYLDLIAAKAKQLAEDEKHGRLWEGELKEGLHELSQILNKAKSVAR